MSMPTTVTHQLRFEWELPEEEVGSVLSTEEIQLRKDIAKAFIHNPDTWIRDGETSKPIKPYWLDKSVELEEGNMRFPFRAAVLTAWLCVPKKYRLPKTQDELADMLGLSSDRMFTVWMARNPQIKAVVHASWNEKVLDHLNDSIDAMLEVAATPDYKGKGDRELHFKLAKILNDSIIVNNKGDVDLSKLSFDQKWEIAGLNDPAVQEKLKEELERRASVIDISFMAGENVSA